MLEELPNTTYFAVLESRDGFHLRPQGLEWFTIHHALSNLLFSGHERRAVKSAYQKAVSRIPLDFPESFCRLGWMSELQDWVDSIIRPLGIELKTFEQVNGSETFSLIRFATTRWPLWFKAVGEPNVHEYGISLALARLLPEFVPTIMGVKPEWHGWLMSDSGAKTLAEVQDLPGWQAALTSLADFQIKSIGLTDQCLRAGSKDLRIATLIELVDPFLQTMDGLMKHQTKVPPPVLSWRELSDLSATLKDALGCLDTLQIPDTIGHSDFNPGNILVGAQRCVFIDWAEAHISHPFLTFEYLMSHLRKDYSELIRFEDELRSTYAQRWRTAYSAEHVAEAFLFSPLSAVFAYAAAGNIWNDPDRLKIPQVPGYLRSLTRRMKHEADLLQRRRVECPN